MIRQDLLRAKAAALQLSVDDVADLAKVSRGTVYSLFKDPEYSPSVNKLVAVVKALGLKVCDVIDSEETVEAVV